MGLLEDNEHERNQSYRRDVETWLKRIQMYEEIAAVAEFYGHPGEVLRCTESMARLRRLIERTEFILSR